MLPSHQQPYEQHMNASGRTACGLLVTALLTGDIGVFVLGQVEQSAAVRAKQQRTWTSSFRRRCLVTRAEANGHEAAHLSSRPVLASSEDIQLHGALFNAKREIGLGRDELEGNVRAIDARSRAHDRRSIQARRAMFLRPTSLRSFSRVFSPRLHSAQALCLCRYHIRWKSTAMTVDIDPSTQANYRQIASEHVHFDWSIDWSKQVIAGSATHTLAVKEDGVQEVMYVSP